MAKKRPPAEYEILYGKPKSEADKERQALMAQGITYKILENAIWCLKCNRLSFNLVDVQEKYCGACSWHHTPAPEEN